MKTNVTRPLSERLEEDYEGALRIALGLRPVVFEHDEPPIDPRPCPRWCHYGLGGHPHETDSEHPFDASHALGVAPDVALSLYPGAWNPIGGSEPGYKSAARLSVRLAQVGAAEPTVSVMKHSDNEPAAADSLRLAIADARDLITALTYVVELAEGRRNVVEGAE